MKKLIRTAATAAMLGAAPAAAQSIEITPNASTPSALAEPDQFTGHAVIDSLFPANEFTHGTGGHVTFAPGARTAWHTHPAGQMLIITSGKGWVQEEGQERQVVNAGDVIWIPADINHWHGATDTTSMRHIALTYMLDGSNVTWGDLVTDEEYAVQ